MIVALLFCMKPFHIWYMSSRGWVYLTLVWVFFVFFFPSRSSLLLRKSVTCSLLFFWQKQNNIYLFTSIEYIRYNNIINIAKNINDETANILTTSKLIAYNGIMPTNNMIKSKSPEYSYFWICNVDVQIIDWICNWLTEVDLSIGTNEHRNKTQNQTTLHKTTNNTTSHSDDETCSLLNIAEIYSCLRFEKKLLIFSLI